MKDLSTWLDYIPSLTSGEKICLCLDRITAAAAELQLLNIAPKVIKVAGTNGKGSTVAALSAVYIAAGYNVASYTSPHLFKFNERLRFNNIDCSDALFCDAFAAIEFSASKHKLSYFEYITLAAFYIIKNSSTDIAILEIGLGARLDAVNIMAADLGIITSIDYDHIDRLGANLSDIASEKAGVMLNTKKALYTDNVCIELFRSAAKKHCCELYILNEDFSYKVIKSKYHYNNKLANIRMFIPQIHPAAVTAAITTILLLQDKLKVDLDIITRVLPQLLLPGRCQLLQLPQLVMLDVAHNIASVRYMLYFISQKMPNIKINFVFSCLASKDASAIISYCNNYAVSWYIAELSCTNAMPISLLRGLGFNEYNEFSSLAAAFDAAIIATPVQQLVVAFGSFHVVNEVYSHIKVNY